MHSHDEEAQPGIARGDERLKWRRVVARLVHTKHEYTHKVSIFIINDLASYVLASFL